MITKRTKILVKENLECKRSAMRWRIEIKSILCNEWCSGKTIKCCVRDIVRFIVLCKWHCVHISFGCGCRGRSREQGPLDCRWASPPPPPCSTLCSTVGRLACSGGGGRRCWYGQPPCSNQADPKAALIRPAWRTIPHQLKREKDKRESKLLKLFACHSMLYKILLKICAVNFFYSKQNSNDAFTVR